MATGVVVTTSVRTGPSNPPGPDSGRGFLVGLAERGPSNVAARVASITQFEDIFGVRNSYSGSLYDAARLFFEEGGSTLFVGRVVGPAAAAGLLVLKDRTGGTPLDTARIVALSAGAWSATIKIAVVAGTVAGTVRVDVYVNDVATERWDNIADIPTLVARLLNSAHVRGVDLGAASTYPTRLPALLAPTVLSTGTDDRGAVTTSHVLAAANALFPDTLGAGAVAAPGYPASTIGAGLIAHAKATGRMAILAGGSADDAATVKSTAATLAAAPDGDYGMIFFPWVRFPDGSGVRSASPEGAVMGKRAKAHDLVGFWQPAAGGFGEFTFVTATEVAGNAVSLSTADIDSLSDGKVNGIVTIGTALKIYGWSSLSAVEGYELGTARDILNVLTALAKDILEPYVWTVIDGRGQMISNIAGEMGGMLQPLADRDAFYPNIDPDTGDVIDPGYSVTVNSANNPTSVAANNRVVTRIAVRTSPYAKLIEVAIVKAGLNSSV